MGDKQNGLEYIKSHRKEILLAEIGALIHDIGKLHKKFIEKHATKNGNNVEYDHGDILKEDAKRNDDLGKIANQLLNKLQKIEIKLDSSQYVSLDRIMEDHHPERNLKKNITSLPRPLIFIIAADRFDAEEDRGHATDRQESVDTTFRSSIFGEETKVNLSEFEAIRKKIYDKLKSFFESNDVASRRSDLLDFLKKELSKGLGMTARAANDVTLWDHSYMVASITKVLVVSYFLDKNFNISSKQDIIKNKPFKIFAVGWDFFEFIEQSHKVPDIIGRIKKLKDIKQKIKKVIEEDFPIGNSIYDDDFGIYFLVPKKLSDDDITVLEKKIFEIFNDEIDGILLPVFHIELPDKGSNEFRIGKMLTKAIQEIKRKIIKKEVKLFETPKWVMNWTDSQDVDRSNKKLICSICNKGFYYKSDEEKICKKCRNIRNLGRERNTSRNTSHKDVPQTIFIDEIAWDPRNGRYGNICLLFLSFDLETWLNGVYVRSLFIKKPIEKKPIGRHIGGPIKRVLKETLRNYLDKKWCEEIENNIKSELNKEIKKLLKSVLKPIDVNEIIKEIIGRIKMVSSNKKIKEIMGDINRIVDDILRSNKREIETWVLHPNRDYQKPPSPSRIMRIWRETTMFFNIINEIINESEKEGSCIIREYILKVSIPPTKKDMLKENIPYPIEIYRENLIISGEAIFEKNNDSSLILRIVTPHVSEKIKRIESKIGGAEITIRHPEKRDHILAKGHIISVIDQAETRAHRVITISPTLFMILIPAWTAFEVIKKILKEYQKRIGKVFGKLPLHIGLIFQKRKTPMFIVIDSARKMWKLFEMKEDIVLEVLNVEKSNNFIKITCVEEKSQNGKNGKSPIEYTISIPYRLGDNDIDYYHPYLICKDCLENSIVKTKVYDSIEQIHVSALKKGDKIGIAKYFFDFELIDSNIRRFDIGKIRRHWLFSSSHNKPRPYFLWDLDNFERLRKIIEACGLTDTQVLNFYELLVSKIEDWNIRNVDDLRSEVFERFVENAIKSVPLRLTVSNETRRGRISQDDYAFLKESVLNGMFFDFVDLWHTILKQKFGRR